MSGIADTSQARLSTVRAAALYMLMSLIAASTVLPLLWMVSTSLKQPSVPYSNFLPGTPTLRHYAEALRETPFVRYYVNSIVIAAAITAGQLITSAMAGYAFARLRFPGRNQIFFAYIATMMIPSAVTMVPLFILLTRVPIYLNDWFGTGYFTSEQFFLGRIFAGVPLGADSYFVLIAPLLFSPFGTFLLRQFFIAIPRSLDEAAMLDGCGPWRTFTQIILPLSKPALATLAIFTFMSAWGAFLWPLIMVNSDEMKPLPVGLAGFIGMYATNWPLLMSGATMMLIPMIVVFVFCQRFFVRGIQLGAVKG